MSWKATLTLDFDHDASNATATYYDDKDVTFASPLFTYGRRVTASDLNGDLKNFANEAVNAKTQKDAITSKAAVYQQQL
ncbi:MAG: hypothetical protein LUO93_01890, partial [Methanomicrobiales archaeon]|nr:hypothetical protein [Methanomicrobiales archaeon]